MTRFEKLLDAPKTFQTLCGLTPKQFQLLAAQVEPLFLAADAMYRDKRTTKAKRQRKTGAGKQLKLSLPELVFATLLYYRTYVNQVFVAFIMASDDSSVSRYITRMEPVLAQVFRIPTKKIDLTQDEVWELIVDATEQRSNRSKGSGYSGKKKTHTVKTQFTVSRSRHIVAVSKTVPGQRPDKKLYDNTKAYATQGSIQAHNKDGPPPRLTDLGYVGVPGAILPIKKKRMGTGEPKDKLTKESKGWNRLLGSNRVVVEHVFSFSGIKKFQIIRDRYRNPIHRYNVTIKNIAGLHNFVLDNPDG